MTQRDLIKSYADIAVRLGADLNALAALPSPVAPPPAAAAPAAPANDLGSPWPSAEAEGQFYDFLRGNRMLGPKISANEYGGCDAIIKACFKAGFGIAFAAYCLATAYHETAHTMQPIHELGGPTYLHRMYDIQGNRPNKARELGNLTPGDGVKYAGRGYVQLTGKSNYAKATAKLRAYGLDVDLVADPDLAMRPDIAALIMVFGMLEGWFTSRKLPDDLPRTGPATLRQFVLSRDIINGTDKDDEIAAEASDFQTGLQAGQYREAA